jgi:Family of unknown function (DUF5995)
LFDGGHATMVSVPLEQLLRQKAPRRIVDVVERLRAIEAALPPTDGVAHFTALYREVTEAVAGEARAGWFEDGRSLRWLDVTFANLYIAALGQFLRGERRCPHAWRPLFEARSRPGVAPIQFALAGMNAHVNRDLPVALVETWRALGIEPRRGSPHHRDFGRVNGLLATVEATAKARFSEGLVGVADEALGRLDDVLAMWKVERAREAAWVNAEALWAVRRVPFLRARLLLALDRTVGFAGRGLLVRVLD